MTGGGREWQDRMLRAAARGRLSLPVDARERTRADQFRRAATIAAAGAFALAIANTAVLYFAGLLPGYRDPGIRGPDTGEIATLVILWVPLGVGAFLLALLGFIFVLRVRDTDGHPWIFRATETDFTIVDANGTVIQAPWLRWRYEGYRYNTYRGAQLAVTGLELSVDGRPVSINFLRVPAPRRLLRAILQRLAAHGGAAA